MTSMNWMDLMVNVTLVDDANEHVCEIQIVHAKMLVARENLGGHGPYAQLRAATEILEVLGSQTPQEMLSLRECSALSMRGGSHKEVVL